MTRFHPLPVLGSAASALLHAGSAARIQLYQAGWLRRRRLRAKVISIGNIAWGGTGKTPFVIWLAQRLSDAGLRPSILTRGYRRASREPVRILPAGSDPRDAQMDGDEVQLYLRHLSRVPVGVSASRYGAGRRIEEQFPVDVHLLDDGFQHLALPRDGDIVLIDAANPWGARPPFGSLLRESPRALRRAGAMLLTNCDTLDAAGSETLQATLHELSPDAMQFFSKTRLMRFVSADGSALRGPAEMRGTRCMAFCGIAGPSRFLAMLERAGVHCVAHRFFRDHHRYTATDVSDLEQFARQAGADCLVTTEKDMVNLNALPFPLPLWIAEIAMAIEKEDALLAWLMGRLGNPLLPKEPGEAAAEHALNR